MLFATCNARVSFSFKFNNKKKEEKTQRWMQRTKFKSQKWCFYTLRTHSHFTRSWFSIFICTTSNSMTRWIYHFDLNGIKQTKFCYLERGAQAHIKRYCMLSLVKHTVYLIFYNSWPFLCCTVYLTFLFNVTQMYEGNYR